MRHKSCGPNPRPGSQAVMASSNDWKRSDRRMHYLPRLLYNALCSTRACQIIALWLQVHFCQPMGLRPLCLFLGRAYIVYQDCFKRKTKRPKHYFRRFQALSVYGRLYSRFIILPLKGVGLQRQMLLRTMSVATYCQKSIHAIDSLLIQLGFCILVRCHIEFCDVSYHFQNRSITVFSGILSKRKSCRLTAAYR